MIKKLLAIGAMAIAFPAQAAVVINYTPGLSPPPPGLTVIEDFESFAPLASIGTNANAYNASISGTAAKPAFNSSGNFGAVLAGGTYNITFAPTSIFSFVLGSLDSYNKLTLFFASGGPVVYNGSQINNGPVADGNQVGSGTNGRVSYTVTGSTPLITGARFESIGSNAFEFDDMAVAAVPEPSTWMMMLLGFAAVGFSMRRKQNLRPSFA
jgi:PEP-CTERM motif